LITSSTGRISHHEVIDGSAGALTGGRGRWGKASDARIAMGDDSKAGGL